MTTSDELSAASNPESIEKLKENMTRVEELSKRLADVMSRKVPHNPALDGPNQELYARAATAYWAEAMQNPAKILEQQVEYWSKSVLNFAEAQKALAGKLENTDDGGPKDRRFSNPLWESSPYFHFVKQQYMTNADAIRKAVQDAVDLDRKDKQRLTYFADQIIEMMAPTNFLPTNPDALKRPWRPKASR